MKKNALTVLILATFVLVPCRAQDAGEILDAYFDNIGQDRLVQVNTVTTVGKIDQMGMVMPFKTISKRPNLGYMQAEVEGIQMKMAFDGKRGWMVMPMTGSDAPIDLTGPDLVQIKEIGDIDSPLWNWKEKGHVLEYSGTEDIEGTRVHVLKLTKDDGSIISYYIDAGNMNLLRTRSQINVNGSQVEVVNDLSDHREVDGIIQPFKIVSSMGGQATSTITFDEVRYDDQVDDAIFSKPVPE